MALSNSADSASSENRFMAHERTQAAQSGAERRQWRQSATRQEEGPQTERDAQGDADQDQDYVQRPSAHLLPEGFRRAIASRGFPILACPDLSARLVFGHQ